MARSLATFIISSEKTMSLIINVIKTLFYTLLNKTSSGCSLMMHVMSIFFFPVFQLVCDIEHYTPEKQVNESIAYFKQVYAHLQNLRIRTNFGVKMVSNKIHDSSICVVERLSQVIFMRCVILDSLCAEL